MTRGASSDVYRFGCRGGFLRQLASGLPTWTRHEQLAFWIDHLDYDWSLDEE